MVQKISCGLWLVLADGSVYTDHDAAIEHARALLER